jgi:hypothetical protein
MTKTKTTNSKVASKNVLLSIIIGAALIISTAINGVPTVAALDQIHSSRIVSASVEHYCKSR